MFLKVLLTVSYMLILTRILYIHIQMLKGAAVWASSFLKSTVNFTLLLCNGQSLRRRSEIPPKLRTTNLVWATRSSWEHLLVDGHLCLVLPCGSAQQPVMLPHLCPDAHSSQGYSCPQSSCYTQFIKMITQATAEVGGLESTQTYS